MGEHRFCFNLGISSEFIRPSWTSLPYSAFTSEEQAANSHPSGWAHTLTALSESRYFTETVLWTLVCSKNLRHPKWGGECHLTFDLKYSWRKPNPYHSSQVALRPPLCMTLEGRMPNRLSGSDVDNSAILSFYLWLPKLYVTCYTPSIEAFHDFPAVLNNHFFYLGLRC